MPTQRVIPVGRRARGAAVIAAGALVVLAAQPCFAQQWHVGFRSGMTASTMHFQNAAARSAVLATPGFHAGVLAGLKGSRIVGIQLELLYSQKGFDSDDEKLKLSYVEVPVLLSLRWPVTMSPRLFAGPVLSFETSCTVHRVPGLDTVGCDAPLESVQRRKADLGFAVGGGAGFRLGRGAVFVELWANQGIRDISLEPRPPGWVRNRALLLSVGYEFTRGGRR